MSGELSTILDHIEKIRELDLDGVEPTSHVVELENVLRADEPRPSWPREQILEPAPDPAEGGFRVRARGVATSARADRAEAAERGGRDVRGRVLRRLPRGAPEGDELTRSSGARAGSRRRRRRRAAGRRPDRGQGHLLRRGGPDDRGVADPRGLPAAVHRDGGAEARERGRPDARQDQHGRVRDGLLERELRLRPGAQPVGPGARPGGSSGGSAAAVAGRAGAVGDRHRHRRLDPPTGRALRDRRPEAHLRRRSRATG